MIITRATEHSITAVLYLARQYPSDCVSKRDICSACGISPAFLTKILQPLIKNAILGSKRGVSGGFCLSVDPEKVTLWDVLKAVEEPLALNLCLVDEDTCDRVRYCPVHEIWADVRGYMEKAFSRKTLAQIVAEMDKKEAQ